MKNRHFINDTLIGTEKIKSIVRLNKPIYVGTAILDVSKDDPNKKTVSSLTHYSFIRHTPQRTKKQYVEKTLHHINYEYLSQIIY